MEEHQQEQPNEGTEQQNQQPESGVHSAREADLENQLEKLKKEIEDVKAENQRLFVMNRNQDPGGDPNDDPEFNAKQFIQHGFNPEYLYKE